MLRARIALIAALVVTALGGCGLGDDASADDGTTPGPGVGTVVPAMVSGDVEGRTVRVATPGRAFDITVGSPRAEIETAEDGGLAETLRAREGTAFVGVLARQRDSGGDGYALSGLLDPGVEPEVGLLVDGETLAVGVPGELSLGQWVVVPAEADDIGVAVTYDGVVQTVASVVDDDPVDGPELLYADPPGLHQERCEADDVTVDPESEPEYVLGACTMRATEPLPYVAGSGWAPEGQGWVVVDIGIISMGAGWDPAGPGGAVSYDLTATGMDITLDGRAPDEVQGWSVSGSAQPLDEPSGEWEGRAVFSVDPDRYEGELVFARTFRAPADDPDEAAAEGAPADLDGAFGAAFTII